MSGQRVAQGSVHYRDSTPGRDSSKPRRQWTVSEETVSRRNRLLVLALSTCLVVAVAALGLLLAPLIARNYYLESQTDSRQGLADDELEAASAPLFHDAPRVERASTRRLPAAHLSAATEVVPPPKSSIFCVLDQKVAASSAALSAPYRFCSHVVVCCGAVDLTWLDVEGAYIGPAAASLKRSHPSVGRIMGIGGPSTNATVLSRALNNTGNLTKLVANIVRTVKRLGFDWGSLVDVRHPELLKKPEKLAHFVRALCLSAARESLQTAVVLPTDPGAEAELHESLRTVNAPRHLTLVKLTDATKLERLGTVPCPVPEKVLDAFEVEQAAAQRPRWFVALSAALAEYGATVEGDDKAGVRFRRLVSRAELCRGKGWKVRRTGSCVVASSGSLSRVALDPHSDWGSWRKAQGVVIFDMRLDDTRGKCGPPYSFTRSVYFALESHAGR